MDVSRYFVEGGVWMYIILLLQFPALFLALAGLAFAFLKRDQPRSSNAFVLPVLAIAVGLLVFGIGVAGWQVGLTEMREALPMAAEAMQGKLRREAERLASYPLIYGTAIGVPTVIGGIMAGFMGWRRPVE